MVFVVVVVVVPAKFVNSQAPIFCAKSRVQRSLKRELLLTIFVNFLVSLLLFAKVCERERDREGEREREKAKGWNAFE